MGPTIQESNCAILAVAYAVDGNNMVQDVSTATAFSNVGTQVPADYLSGSGVSNILPFMGMSQIMLPIYAVVDLETAELLYFQDGNGTGPEGALPHIQGASE